MKVKEESEKAGLKVNIQKTEIMASGPITSWEIWDSDATGQWLGSHALSVPEAEPVQPQWAGSLQWSPGPAQAAWRVPPGRRSQPEPALLAERQCLRPGPSGSSSPGPSQALSQACVGRAASLLLAPPDIVRHG